jgi:hypothetical protein
VLGQRLANPHILAVIGANKQYEVIPSSIVGMEEVRDYAQ